MSSNDNVVVVTRVRPFNERENQQNAQCIVTMPADTSIDLANPAKPGAVHGLRSALIPACCSRQANHTSSISTTATGPTTAPSL